MISPQALRKCPPPPPSPPPSVCPPRPPAACLSGAQAALLPPRGSRVAGQGEKEVMWRTMFRSSIARSGGRAVKRPYKALTWKDRLQAQLEPEIVSQIPKDVSARTPVHFGISFKDDPKAVNAAQRLEKLKTIVERLKQLAPENGLPPEDLTYAMARQGFWEEEALFIDRETDMSQTLYRQKYLGGRGCSGADRTHFTLGGLAALEAALVTTELDLAQGRSATSRPWKPAQRLEPRQQYRVLFMGPVVTGVLAHEAFGHAQEADTCARGRSKAWELHKSGEHRGQPPRRRSSTTSAPLRKTAASLAAAWGSYYFDEEGRLAERAGAFDHNSKLLAPMTNLTSAIRLGVPRTANGKRESWANGVYTRQTNTYFSAGDRTLSQLMKDLGDGFLATHPAGGMEDPKGMGIQVGLAYLQEVKSGKLTGRVFKGPAGGDIQMTGCYAPDVLNSDRSQIQSGRRELRARSGALSVQRRRRLRQIPQGVRLRRLRRALRPPRSGHFGLKPRENRRHEFNPHSLEPRPPQTRARRAQARQSLDHHPGAHASPRALLHDGRRAALDPGPGSGCQRPGDRSAGSSVKPSRAKPGRQGEIAKKLFLLLGGMPLAPQLGAAVEAALQNDRSPGLGAADRRPRQSRAPCFLRRTRAWPRISSPR